MEPGLKLVFSCEHGGRDVPERYRPLFRGWEALLESHRGYDPGTLELARTLAEAHAAPLVATTVTRLLVDTNRSRGHRRLFSEITRHLEAQEKEQILRRYHEGHRQRVTEVAGELLETGGEVLHLGVHSFTPVLDGEERPFDVGWLYDSKRRRERRVVDRLIAALARIRPDLKQRRNAPYLGSADGLTTTLRRRFLENYGESYLGVELEVNQKHPLGERAAWRRLIEDLARAVGEVVSAANGAIP